jgi:hypothetical protein
MCSSSGRPFVHAGFYGMFFMRFVSSLEGGRMCLHKCMKNIPYKTACTNGLPDDEHMIFKTCRRHKELN